MLRKATSAADGSHGSGSGFDSIASGLRGDLDVVACCGLGRFRSLTGARLRLGSYVRPHQGQPEAPDELLEAAPGPPLRSWSFARRRSPSR